MLPQNTRGTIQKPVCVCVSLCVCVYLCMSLCVSVCILNIIYIIYIILSLLSLFLSLFLSQEWEDEQERVRMREVSKRLYAQLQDAEKKHQEDREKLQVCLSSLPLSFSLFISSSLLSAPH